MNTLSISKMVNGSVAQVCEKVQEALKPAGFGILTRIDFDQKIQEKLGETIKPCVILGACNPQLALNAYKQSSDVALLIPCNIAVTEVESGRVKVEAIRPTAMLNFLKDVGKSEEISVAEKKLEQAIESLS